MSAEYVSVYTANGQADGQLIVMLLEAAGIRLKWFRKAMGIPSA